MTVKNFIRPFYYFYLFLNHNFQIFTKELIYKLLTLNVKTSYLLDEERIFKKVKLNLNNRGINWPFQPGYKPHIVYASIPSHWEMINIPHELKKIGNLSTYFTNERGIDVSNRKIARKKIDEDFLNWIDDLHKISKIDIVITYFSGAEISSKTIEKIKIKKIPIFTFHLDDRLHFFGHLVGNIWSGPYSVCKAYDLNLTNSTNSLRQYFFHKSLALFWPEAANPDYFKPQNSKKEIDVLFIGANYGKRKKLISFLKENNINVQAYGYNWPNGSVTSNEMIQLISKSKITIGFGFVGFSNYQCLKGRDFEFPSCGTVYLTSHNKELEYCYKIGTEIMTYKNNYDCLKKIKEILNNDDLLSEISKSSRESVLKNHTWEKRFKKIIYNNF